MPHGVFTPNWVRYTLAAWLLATGDDAALEDLLGQYPDEGSACAGRLLRPAYSLALQVRECKDPPMDERNGQHSPK
jgi:hypothetical protein